ncbi:MAG: hypothetical protein EBZ61_08410 [Micrococcales bacterium]|nr:hypothetical protein [Micrococcales bacterium]
MEFGDDVVCARTLETKALLDHRQHLSQLNGGIHVIGILHVLVKCVGGFREKAVGVAGPRVVAFQALPRRRMQGVEVLHASERIL